MTAPIDQNDTLEQHQPIRRKSFFDKLIIYAINRILDHLPEEDQLRVLQGLRHRNARENAKLVRNAYERQRRERQ